MKYAVFILSVLFFATTAHAQIGNISPTTINVIMNPQTPGANETVVVDLTSFATSIDAAKITWKVNGKIEKSGSGLKKFSFVTGNSNTTTSLDIVIVTSEGETITKSYKIKPVSVDLIWQSNGYVPAFYKGKALFAHESGITFIALPHIRSSSGSEISPKNLIYRWTRNGEVVEAASGYGKNTFTFTGALISRPLEVEVTVTSGSGSETGYAHTTVTPTDPFILFYRKDPLYGIEFQKALTNNYTLEDQEIAVVSSPFFFGTQSASNPILFYKWSINGVPIDNDPGATTQVFRKKEGVTGVSNISLSVENTRKILQLATANFNLNFK